MPEGISAHDLYLFDEPLNGININSQKVIRDVIKDLKSDDRVVIVTSHNGSDIDYLCDEVYAVKDGKVARI